MILALYRLATSFARPLIKRWLAYRVRIGKEDPARTGERMGVATRPRPAGVLLWIHGASIGESLSVLRLIERLLEENDSLSVLVTSGTLTSGQILETRLPLRAFHQYAPIDLPPIIEAFLDHWRPDFALWVESEFWPHCILETARRQVGMILLNGRISASSRRLWRLIPGTIRHLLSCFRLCLTPDQHEEANFRLLGAPRIKTIGNLKWTMAPLPCSPEALADFKQHIGERPVWLASSTHQGEEKCIADVHRRLKQEFPRLLTIIAPRHPERSPAIRIVLQTAGLEVACRSVGELPDREIYLADTLGELGLFYRLAGIVFLGGSLIPHGGHNPIEAARLDCALVSGPHTQNFGSIMAAFEAGKGLWRADDAASLAGIVKNLMTDKSLHLQAVAANQGVLQAHQDILDRLIEEIGICFPTLLCRLDHASP